MQSFNTLTLLLTALTAAGLCNASPRFIRPDQLPGARAVEAAVATETGSPGLNTSLAINSTIYIISSSASVTVDTAPTTTAPPSLSSASEACIPIMMQVDYLHCGKRGGYRYDVNSCDGKPRSTPSLAPCSTASADISS